MTGEGAEARSWSRLGRRLQAFLVSQFLLVSYLIAITFALAWPEPGRAVGSVKVADNVRLVQSINIIIVFFITGLVLRTDELLVALRQRLGVLWGFLSILAITPCLAFAFREIPLSPPAFAAGLALFCVVPTTLGVGVSLVRSCRGNEALALLLTVGTNVVAIFLMPLWLKALYSGQSELNLSVDVGAMLVKLLVTVLAPAALGKLLRDLCKLVERFAIRHRTALGLFSTANLAFIVWIVLSGARDVLLEQRFVSILEVILLAVAQHLAYLAFNFAVVWYVLRMPAPEAVASGIMASQKSSPVAVTVISYITTDSSLQGLMAIPCLVGQIFQVFIGSALVPVLSRLVKRHQAASSGGSLAVVVVSSSSGAALGSEALGARSGSSKSEGEGAPGCNKASLDGSGSQLWEEQSAALAAGAANLERHSGSAAGAAPSVGQSGSAEGAVELGVRGACGGTGWRREKGRGQGGQAPRGGLQRCIMSEHAPL